MYLTLEIPEESLRQIASDAALAEKAREVFAFALETAAVVGADDIRRQLVAGELGLTMRHPGQAGLAAALEGVLLDAEAPLAAIRVPANTPAGRYAGILNDGGTIRPRQARALAVPLTDEARRRTSPRDMNLVLIRPKGKPPLLVEMLSGGGFRPHWVLLASVFIPARHWADRGAAAAGAVMTDAFVDVLDERLIGEG